MRFARVLQARSEEAVGTRDGECAEAANRFAQIGPSGNESLGSRREKYATAAGVDIAFYAFALITARLRQREPSIALRET